MCWRLEVVPRSLQSQVRLFYSLESWRGAQNYEQSWLWSWVTGRLWLGTRRNAHRARGVFQSTKAWCPGSHRGCHVQRSILLPFFSIANSSKFFPITDSSKFCNPALKSALVLAQNIAFRVACTRRLTVGCPMWIPYLIFTVTKFHNDRRTSVGGNHFLFTF